MGLACPVGRSLSAAFAHRLSGGDSLCTRRGDSQTIGGVVSQAGVVNVLPALPSREKHGCRCDAFRLVAGRLPRDCGDLMIVGQVFTGQLVATDPELRKQCVESFRAIPPPAREILAFILTGQDYPGNITERHENAFRCFPMPFQVLHAAVLCRDACATLGSAGGGSRTV